ncbi:MAG: hypothetical protein DRI90_03370 [Deltaproteobacteria bacterium]|nr:MAG: hypothetical protein DRI90_03370 [Deltaproteobacteria bacterium]
MLHWLTATVLGLTVIGSTVLTAATAAAAPRHDLCADVGDSFAFGVSSYGDLRDWAPTAKETHGADFRFIYVYILNGGMNDPDNFSEWYVTPFIQTAKAMDAVPVLTFYQLLDLGIEAGYSGSEAEIVQSALADGSVMRSYFDNFVWLLQLAHELGPPIIIHVEPDSWGFMMWAMGVEGNDDPTSVNVAVTGSGHPDVIGFANDAAGLGHALVALRERYAPEVRLGWHASNFRVGTRPDVVTSFYAQLGDWDLLVGEHPHVEDEGASWWEPWVEDRLEVNLTWLSTVTSAAGVPLMFWQEPIGGPDYHLIGDPNDLSMLDRFAAAGAVGLLFDHQKYGDVEDPDDFRSYGTFGEVPPDGHPAGGTAADMRDRVAAYSQAPLSWPSGSVCDTGVETGTPEINQPGATGADYRDDSGCGCHAVSTESRGASWLWVLATAAVATVRRRQPSRSRYLGGHGS